MTVEQVSQQTEVAPAAPGEGESFAEQMQEPITVQRMHRALLEVVKSGFRLMPDRWDACSAHEQNDILDRASLAIDKATRAAVDALAGELRPTVSVEIDSVKFGDKVQIVCIASRAADFRHAIADSAKGTALLVLAEYPVRTSHRAGDTTPPKADVAVNKTLPLPLGETQPPEGATQAADGETTSENSETTSENSEAAGADGETIKGPFTAYVEGQSAQEDGATQGDGGEPKFE